MGGALKNLVMVAVGALAMMACAGESYQVPAMEASDSGDQKTAASLAKKEVARFSGPDQCSPASTLNCGTLALAYGTLAGYQIMGGDKTAGEGSFRSAKEALGLTDLEIRPGATAMVYRDVSEAFWKVGDRARAVDVFKEGRTAGADKYLYMSSAARFVDRQAADQKAADQKPGDQQPADRPPADSPKTYAGIPAAVRSD